MYVEDCTAAEVVFIGEFVSCMGGRPTSRSLCGGTWRRYLSGSTVHPRFICAIIVPVNFLPTCLRRICDLFGFLEFTRSSSCDDLLSFSNLGDEEYYTVFCDFIAIFCRMYTCTLFVEWSFFRCRSTRTLGYESPSRVPVSV